MLCLLQMKGVPSRIIEPKVGPSVIVYLPRVPAVKLSPVITLTRVDLPAPFSPSKACTSPPRSEKETWCNTSTLRKTLANSFQLQHIIAHLVGTASPSQIVKPIPA